MSDDPDLPLPVQTAPDTDPTPGGARRRWRWMVLLPLIPLLILIGGIVGLYFQPPGLRLVFDSTGLTPGAGSSAPIALPPEIRLPADVVETIVPSDVVGLARLMPRGDVITVAPPFGAGDARIAEILVTEGDEVAAHELLARLDNAAQLQAAVLAAEANVAVREAALAQTEAAIRASRDEAEATLAQAEAAAEEAASDYARSRTLTDRGIATTTQTDALRTGLRQAELAVARARATLARFSGEDGGAALDIVVARRNLDAARVELTRAESDVIRSEVRAPVAGTILSIDARPGERPPLTGIMQMGDTRQMMAEVEVYQDRIAAVAPGQPVELVASAIGETFLGRVQSIGLTVGRQGLLPDDIAANTDARVVTVLVALEGDRMQTARRYTGLEVVARIDTRPGGAAADPPP
ncbi:HlyD family efflux transporter periplasmic adaptor subunit [Paracoccus jeotgali]|uniref:HlyD family efflux transporter periplasmic adaptor subunit n=1 Tax=Paracoccus jeotgali TaxID=2065379 RepID=UPI0028AD257F|nr:HlyD family efflux transporter periplasmic adaptor subunit [Paracoccus jeotgali]